MWKWFEDHPRSRGEYRVTEPCRPDESGSSPLSRGIRRRDQETRHRVGIIPALAGNTAAPHWRSFRRPDHPRSRGEYGPFWPYALRWRGSSPLSRGIRPPSKQPWPTGRIIPALAGNTRRAHSWAVRSPDHPRSRGEYSNALALMGGAAGSSPLSRGIRPPGVGRTPRGGIIPALAGNTGPWRVRTGRPGDHPRSRGEYDGDRCPTAPCAGSSPLSRGIRSWTVFRPPCRGIIPALAGNTSTVGTTG